nr:hypothetical protein [Moorena sp. SIO1G6]
MLKKDHRGLSFFDTSDEFCVQGRLGMVKPSFVASGGCPSAGEPPNHEIILTRLGVETPDIPEKLMREVPLKDFDSGRVVFHGSFPQESPNLFGSIGESANAFKQADSSDFTESIHWS